MRWSSPMPGPPYIKSQTLLWSSTIVCASIGYGFDPSAAMFVLKNTKKNHPLNNPSLCFFVVPNSSHRSQRQSDWSSAIGHHFRAGRHRDGLGDVEENRAARLRIGSAPRRDQSNAGRKDLARRFNSPTQMSRSRRARTSSHLAQGTLHKLFWHLHI